MPTQAVGFKNVLNINVKWRRKNYTDISFKKVIILKISQKYDHHLFIYFLDLSC